MTSKIRSTSLLHLISILTTAIFISCASTGSKTMTSTGLKEDVDEIIAAMPAKESNSESRYFSDIVNLGPEAVSYICAMIIPPGQGDDSGARYALSGLAGYVFRPDAEDERMMFSSAMVDALNGASDVDVKAFFIRQLQSAGKNEAVPALGEKLYDKKLCEPAVQALIEIGTKSAEATLIRSLEDNSTENCLTIIYALGKLQSKASVFRIMEFLASENEDIRNAVIYSLANIGPVTPVDIINSESEKKSSTGPLKLLYAERLLESGQREKCADLCRELIKSATLPEDENTVISALNILYDAVGESALWDLIHNVENPNKKVRAGILRIAENIPGTNSTIEWLNKEKNTLDPIVRRDIQLMLLRRDRNFSVPALKEAKMKWADENGFRYLFNGKDLTGWKGLVGNPITRANMSTEELSSEQEKADKLMHEHWRVENGILIFDGHGSHLCTTRDYKDFEMLVDWKIEPEGDSGIYLRGSPQVQIWDPAQWPVGSGGLYNNQDNPSKPLVSVDNPIGEWNNFRIRMIGDKVTVFLNGVLVADNVTMENYWDRSQPIFPTGQIELQSHGSKLHFREIKIKELGETEVALLESSEPDFVLEEGFALLFNGNDLTGWFGDTQGYVAEDGKIVVHPERGGGSGNLYTEKEYADYILRFDFKLTPGANNGLGIRTPAEGDAAYLGMEIQILDNTADIYKDLQAYQYHGSVYGIVPAKRGYLHPVGSWNHKEVIVNGRHITVNLNGVTIVDADLDEASTPETIDGLDHPGLKRSKGYICFCGHGSRVEFKNIRIKEIKK